MPLFESKQDIDHVPIITQMAQIDCSNPDEVLELTKRYAWFGEMETLDYMKKLCDIAYRTLFGIATSCAVPTDCLQWINSNVPQKPRELRLLPSDEKWYGEKELVPLANLQWQDNWLNFKGINTAAVQWELSRTIEKTMQALEKGEPSLVCLCNECGYPMLRNSAKQMFCSTRCANTNSTRKRRARRKAPQLEIFAH